MLPSTSTSAMSANPCRRLRRRLFQNLDDFNVPSGGVVDDVGRRNGGHYADPYAATTPATIIVTPSSCCCYLPFSVTSS
jgi:hypothetical protein